MDHGAGFGAGGAAYGAAPIYKQSLDYDFGAHRKRQTGIVPFCTSLFVPWLLFAFLTSTLSFSVRYYSPVVAHLSAVSCFLLAFLLGYLAYAAWRARSSMAPWYVFVFATTLLACVAGLVLGSRNFAANMEPYFDVTNLSTYSSVDPRAFRGQQLMDMGQALFVPTAKLDLTKSYGFRNSDVYCVAPIVSGNGSMPNYDFWAVGLNCCSGHVPDFACGEYNNPYAHSGLRLMRDDLRPYFRLAVQQAEAAHRIQGRHPIFMYWMQDPQAEVLAYQDEGYKTYLTGRCPASRRSCSSPATASDPFEVIVSFVIQLSLVVGMAMKMSRAK